MFADTDFKSLLNFAAQIVVCEKHLFTDYSTYIVPHCFIHELLPRMVITFIFLYQSIFNVYDQTYVVESIMTTIYILFYSITF